nr:MAG TPA: hypothetical protein [Caudoviricetes sp.]
MKNIMQCRSETERLHREGFTFVFEFIVYKYPDRYSVLPFLQAQAEKDYAVEGYPEKSLSAGDRVCVHMGDAMSFPWGSQKDLMRMLSESTREYAASAGVGDLPYVVEFFYVGVVS